MKLRLGSILLTLCILMSLTTNVYASTAPEDSFLDGMIAYGGHYYKVYDLGMKWTEAKTYCENLGGHLVTITSPEEQLFVERLLESAAKYEYWIGAYHPDDAEEYEFVWITDEYFDHEGYNWAPNSPDREWGGTEKYVHIFGKDVITDRLYFPRYTWNDLVDDPDTLDDPYFTSETIGFICEWEQTTWEDNYFDLEMDTNTFTHDGMKYELTNERYLQKLLDANSEPFSFYNLWQILKELNSGKEYGYCRGLAFAICLADQGLLPLDEYPGKDGVIPNSFSDLLPPYAKSRTNDKFRDLLVYYSLTQYTSQGKPTAKVSYDTAVQSDLRIFLKKLVEESMLSHEEEKAFVFSYVYDVSDAANPAPPDGHCVVVSDYRWNEIMNCHELKIYDPNSFGDGREFYSMYIAEDYSDFSYFGLKNVWRELRYYSIDDIYTKIAPAFGVNAIAATVQDEAAIKILASVDSDFVIVNAEGETLSCSRGIFAGTMETREICYGASLENLCWEITIPYSESLIITNASDGFEIVLSIDEKDYAASCAGADSMTFSRNGIVIQGTDVQYTVTLAPKISEAELTEISGVCCGETRFSYAEDKRSIHVESTGAMEGTAVTQYTLFQPESVSVPNSESYDVVENTDGEAVVIVNEVAYPIEAENPFTDVPEGSFYYEPVLWAVENGITSGASATTFNPNGDCLRAQVVTFLWRAAGCPAPESAANPFVDVKESDFYYNAVLWAVENGITNGADATHFNPMGVCNRAQVVTFLHRAFGSPAVENAVNPFTDVPADSWYTAPVLWAVEQGITNGLSATQFGPNANCNRAQIVTFLYRAYTE